MKKSQLALLIFSLVVTGILFFALSKNKKTDSKEIKKDKGEVFVPIRIVQNNERVITLSAHGQVTPYQQIVLSAEVQGMLKKGSITLKPGTKFKEGQLLYYIDNTEAIYTFIARKAALATTITNLLPDIELDYPKEKDKWMAFSEQLAKGTGLIDLPPSYSQKEHLFLTGRGIIAEYFNLKNLEARLDKYSIVAPFNGTVTDVFMEPGSIANPGVQIARLVKTNDYEVKMPITLEDLDFFKGSPTTSFTDSDGKLIGAGKIERISDVVNQQTQSVDVYYKIAAEKDELIYNGMFLNATIEKEVTKNTFVLPRAAVKNNKVGILNKEGKIEMMEISIVGFKPDSVFVTGLNDGSSVLLEPVEKIDPKVSYKGVIR